VHILRPNLTVIARDGYYPAAVEGGRPAQPASANPPSN